MTQADVSTIIHAAIVAALRDHPDRPLVVGLCGAQGSGKSTVAAALATRLESEGYRSAILSLDDLYLTKAERDELATTIHPLLATRGVPGTHDVDLGLDIFTAIDRGDAVKLPSFDKACDDRRPQFDWQAAPAGTGVLIFEGWCVGAIPQVEAALRAPVNDLERLDDPDGKWRRFANTALAGAYQRLFARVDLQVLLAAPGFEIVEAWRTQQEHDLRARVGNDAPGLLSDAAIHRFVQHYERLTRHILAEMPGRADQTINLDVDRRPVAVMQMRRSDSGL